MTRKKGQVILPAARECEELTYGCLGSSLVGFGGCRVAGIDVKDVAGLAIFDGRRIDGDEFEQDLGKEISASTQVPDRI